MSARFRRLSASFGLCVARLKISSNGLPENQAEKATMSSSFVPIQRRPPAKSSFAGRFA